ncbi:hypothetical protein SEA_LUCKYSOCKE_107 [Streptomyces phage LuckySocke]|jgi:hypothetical protein|nr:hypothetical protein SEA_ALONE_109 [Streptomyces phage Alone3]WPH58961.1 hypothetical protein SEA_LUCKYSOCKE_107 [Streptomyces phage LuckySocke]
MSDRNCDSRYKSPYNGDVASCQLKGGHLTHRGDGYIWQDKDEMPTVKVAEKSVKAVQPTVREKQVGGTHYKGSLQPIDVIDAWGLDFYEGSALKYLARHRKKNGREDIEKAIHYLELLLERQYGARDESV